MTRKGDGALLSLHVNLPGSPTAPERAKVLAALIAQADQFGDTGLLWSITSHPGRGDRYMDVLGTNDPTVVEAVERLNETEGRAVG